MAYSSIGHMGFALVGLAAGTPEGVQGVLVYMAIYLAMTLGTFAVILAMRRDGGMVENISDLAGPRPHQSGAGVLPRAAAVLARRHSAARGLLRQVLRVPRRDQGRPLHARGDRRARQRGRRLLLSADRQDRCISTSPRRASSRCRASSRPCSGVTGLFNLLFFVYPAPLINAASRRRQIVVLMQLDPTAQAAGGAAHRLRHHRLDQRGGAAARARGRARAAVDHRQDARPRAAAAAAAPGCRSPAISMRACCSPTRRRRTALPELSFVAALGAARRRHRAHSGPRRPRAAEMAE